MQKVLVTRPQQQTAALCDLLQGSGIATLAMPMIRIQALSPDRAVLNELANPQTGDCWLFISANAVRQTLRWMDTDSLPEEVRVAVIGQATANALTDIYKGELIRADSHLPANSESLLQHPQLQQMPHQRVFIFKGEGGRPLLAETLTRRGARVREIILYRRQPVEYATDELQQALQQSTVILATSGEILQALQKQFAPWSRQLKQKTLLVISQRLQKLALENGFKQVLLTAQASDQSIADALKLVIQG
ncbi:MAG: uroporphyrinogen-III synthase [gamma proteobacterium symbiont of Bathyaustriella thionipta]|nr:uroporphyrinogen-III synthase [gamma proteobacterium symbiont of Bathyaustriella thionipta]